MPLNGSGDTSYGWAQFFTYLILSFTTALIWTLIDSKSKNNAKILFFIQNLLRYYLGLVAFMYGTIKIFVQQMGFPTLSQLATPLGDFLPMRFSWLFVGYSAPYQIYSGVAEVIVGLLLFYRKTVLAGILMGIAVFVNVLMLNLSYDIPVKLFSFQVLCGFIFLAFLSCGRIIAFFFTNDFIKPDTNWDLFLEKKWEKWLRIFAKTTYLFLFFILALYKGYSWNQNTDPVLEPSTFHQSVYQVVDYERSNKSGLVSQPDSLVWKDWVFDSKSYGSLNCQDTALFRIRYHRGFYNCKIDTIKQTIAFRRMSADTIPKFTLNYYISSKDELKLWGKIKDDSIKIKLKNTHRHFQLAEKQFHWLSESNR